MMNFRHKFTEISAKKSHYEYSSGDNTVHIDFISDTALRVAIFKDGSEILPTFTVDPENELSEQGRDKLSTDGFPLCEPKSDMTDGKREFLLPCGIKITLDTYNFLLSYCNSYGERIFADRAPLAYNFGGEFGAGSFHYVSREDDEHIFALGDKSGYINKAGNSYRIETADSMGYNAEKTDPLYKHVPFYICENRAGAYGIYYDTTDTSYIDLGREINNYYEHFKFFKTDDDCLIYYVFFGSKLSILQQYARLCGKQAFPPRWSFDYCASTMAYTDAPDSENQMNMFLDKIKELDISCGGFYLSSGYTSIGDLRCVFNWNYDKFPDPEKFIKKFADENIHLIPNIKPAFLTSHPMYDELANRGLFVKSADGSPYVTQFWDGVGSYIDFTNPDGFAFWQEQVKEKLLDLGIDATWNDNNEFDIKAADALANGFSNEVGACRIRPALTYLMVLASYKAQREKYPELRPLLSTRSGNSAVRRLAQTWSGDNFTSWRDLRFCHYIGMTMVMSGFYFYGHDLGGFSGDMPSRELLLRWMQHGVFEPRFTIHSWNGDGSATMPWSYEDIIYAARNILAERKRLTPYLYNCAYEAVEEELPVQAPPYLYYDDEEIDVNTDSFMLGRDILAECVLDKGVDEVSVYLPKNEKWYLGDKLYNGGQSEKIKIYPDEAVPFFVRSGSVLPTDEAEYGYQSDEKLVFTVYPIDNGEFESNFFTDDGKSYAYLKNDCVRLHFNVKCTENDVFVTYENTGNMPFEPVIRLIGGDERNLQIIKK